MFYNPGSAPSPAGGRQLSRSSLGASVSQQSKVAAYFVSAALIAIVYWTTADFHVYMYHDDEVWPEFEMPLWWQAIESSIFGLAASGLLLGSGLLIRRGVRHLTSGCS